MAVGAYDPNDGKVACKKNGDKGDYTFTSGIWQAVWLEPVEKIHISQIKLIPDLMTNRLQIEAQSNQSNGKIVAIAKDNGKEVASIEGKTNKSF